MDRLIRDMDVCGIPRPLGVQIEELELLSPRDRMTVSEWASEKRVLSKKTSRFSGAWTHDYTPFMVEPMDSFSDPFVGQVTIAACAQGAKTEVQLNCLGWIADECPGPTLVVMPTEADVRRRVLSRIRPMFRATASLLRHVRGSAENINIGEATDMDNMILYLGWSGSPAALADNPCRFVMLDEVGKFPFRSGREADPVSLGKDRMTTFGLDAALLVTSTMVTEFDLIDREYKSGDMRQWWSRCVYCGGRHVLDFRNVVLDKDKSGGLLDPKEYEKGGRCRYVCPLCRQAWIERDRWRAICAGRWLPSGCRFEGDKVIGKMPATRHRSYRVTALMLHPAFMTIPRLAAEWSAADTARRSGDTGPLQRIINSRLTQPWRQIEQTTDIELLRPHKGRYPMGVVPDQVQLLTMGIDVQIDHVWVIVVGWGYLSESWLIWSGRLETGDTSVLSNYRLVREFAASDWPILNFKEFTKWQKNKSEQKGTNNLPEYNSVMLLAAGAIDCGYRGDTAVDFTLQATESRIVAVRGDDRVRTAVYHPFKVPDKVTKKTRTIRYDLNVTVIKDRLYRLLFESTVPGPGYTHLPCDMPEEFMEHFCSEHKEPVKTRSGQRRYMWMVKEAGRPNHLWDCLVYAAFAAELLGARLLPPGRPVKGAQDKIVGRPVGEKKIRTRY